MKWHPSQYTFLYFDTQEPGWIARLHYYPTKRAPPLNSSWPCELWFYCFGIISLHNNTVTFYHQNSRHVLSFSSSHVPMYLEAHVLAFLMKNATQINVYVTSCKCCRPQYCQLELNGKLQRTFNRNTKLFFRENALQYERHRMSVTHSVGKFDWGVWYVIIFLYVQF